MIQSNHKWFGEDGKPTGVTAPIYPDEASEPVESDRAETLRHIISVLEDGRPRTMAARLEALKSHFGLSNLSIRQAAEKADCVPVTVLEAKRKIKRFFRGKS